MYLASLDIEKN